jgi:Cu+-exporting ATPase
MVTGEPIPVEKKPGDRVTGGTMNGHGTFIFRAEKVGKETLLARIVASVAEAQRSRAPIQSLADRVSAYFVPTVVLVSVITFLVWAFFGPEPRMGFAILNAVAVLIIACPCALGLATPMSVMVGAGRGALAGVLVKNAEMLELMEKVDTLVVDKTGTLTEGRPKVVTVKSVAGVFENDLLRLAGAVERGSEHPISRAIVQAAEERKITLPVAENFVAKPGSGVRAIVDGHDVLVGNERFISFAVSDPEIIRLAAEFRNLAQTIVFVVSDQKTIGLIGIADPIRESTVSALHELKGSGMQIVMVTGDSKMTAQIVSGQLGLDTFYAEVLPHYKATIVAELKKSGRKVAMAGDGINDAPALAVADVGIAMGTGADVAIESAGITLLHGDLRGICRVRKLSCATMRNIRQNLFFAFVYNFLGVPLAAGLFYPFFGWLLSPMIASVAMSFSSVSVIGNSLRLRRLVL